MIEFETTNLEKTSLEAHVDLCAMRYKQLEMRLSNLEDKVENIGKQIQASNNSLKSTIMMSATTILGGLLGLITTILMKF